MTEKRDLRKNIMGELKKEVIPAHINGSFLEKPNEEELKEREDEKRKRIVELEKIKKSMEKNDR